MQNSTRVVPSAHDCQTGDMHEKELRLALICYGGISLAVYMHGVTREVWHLARASRGFHDAEEGLSAVERHYLTLLQAIEKKNDLKLRVLPDIIAGASAGGINGIFLAQAIASGQRLDPLTDMWLENADVDKLLDPDARPLSAATKFWAAPIAWYASGRRGGTVERTVSAEARDEVRAKLSRFVRARWFEPPFGGPVFVNMLLDAFDGMAASRAGPRLLPDGQPLDLFITVTDFAGHPHSLRLHSPAQVMETEHRLTISFTDSGSGLGDAAALAFAARATASFPGAFPPFNVAELDHVLAARERDWPTRESFLNEVFPGKAESAERSVLIDGSVLANAPFLPAMEALRDRPARREVDRRFVYIDPKPGYKAVRLTGKGDAELPGFFATIFGAMSDIPREQPIRDSLDAIEARSARIRRMQRIIDALRPEVEAAIEAVLGNTFFLDRPTPARVRNWREKAQQRAARDAGFAFPAYAHVKLAGIVEDIAGLVSRRMPRLRDESFEGFRQQLWAEVRARGIDSVSGSKSGSINAETVEFFRAHDLGFRVRRLRFCLRTIASLEAMMRISADEAETMRATIFRQLAPFIELQRTAIYPPFHVDDPSGLLRDLAAFRGLVALDHDTDAAIAHAASLCPKDQRRVLLFAYLGYPFYDISTLPMLQGEGLDEFDPVKVDRISPDDAGAIRSGVTETLKGVEFNSFGAFFSRAYRENDYLWGRLHGAERLFDIVASSGGVEVGALRAMKYDLLAAILDEEQPRLRQTGDLIATLRCEIAARGVQA